MTSRMLLMPVANMINLSKPRPKPLCGTEPYFLKSMYPAPHTSWISKSRVKLILRGSQLIPEYYTILLLKWYPHTNVYFGGDVGSAPIHTALQCSST